MSQLRGVNVGGWLVLERWMTPALFEGTGAADEYTFCRSASARRLAALRRHRDSFITEADFRWIATQGLNAVRLPAGWAHDHRHAGLTVQFVRELAGRYGGHPALWGVGLLNEPAASIPRRELRRYYEIAHGVVRAAGDHAVVMSDGFRPRRFKRVLAPGRFAQLYRHAPVPGIRRRRPAARCSCSSGQN